MKTLGQIAYEAYCAKTGGVSAITGAKLPPWDGQIWLIREAWEAAADAVSEKLVETDRPGGDE